MIVHMMSGPRVIMVSAYSLAALVWFVVVK